MYIHRHAENSILKMTTMFKVILLTGPRQVGKTTLLKYLFGHNYTYITFDDINELEVARSDPKLFFINNPGKLIIDEVQYAPEIFIELKRIVDKSNDTGRFILTGSQTFSLMHNVSESLAGRIGIFELNGLSLREINNENFILPIIPNQEYLNANRIKTDIITLWKYIYRGSMPAIYENVDIDWQLFYSSYVKTYIERDVRLIINVKDLNTFSRFLTALAARTSQLLNYSKISNELGVDLKTIKSWVSVLETSGIITIIQPFSNNQLSRAIKTPKLYFMDTGLVCYLLKWSSPETLMNGALSGQILENFVISEVIKSYKNGGILNVPIYFYQDKDLNEIDIILENSQTLYPIEIKKTASPNLTMIKHLSIIDKTVGYNVGQKSIFCLIDKKINLASNVVAFPITEL